MSEQQNRSPHKRTGSANRKNAVVLAISVPIVAAFVLAVTIGPWVWVSLTEDLNVPPTSQEETAAAAEVLRGRASAEEKTQQFTAVAQMMSDAAAAISPSVVWSPYAAATDSTRGCPKPFDRTYGQITSKYHFSARSSFSEQQWPELADRIRSAVQPMGFQVVFRPRTEPDKGQSTISVVDPTGTGRVSLFDSAGPSDTVERTTISSTTDCHLPADKFSSPIRPTS